MRLRLVGSGTNLLPADEGLVPPNLPLPPCFVGGCVCAPLAKDAPTRPFVKAVTAGFTQ